MARAPAVIGIYVYKLAIKSAHFVHLLLLLMLCIKIHQKYLISF
jgi:hypothetical protein